MHQPVKSSAHTGIDPVNTNTHIAIVPMESVTPVRLEPVNSNAPVGLESPISNITVGNPTVISGSLNEDPIIKTTDQPKPRKISRAAALLERVKEKTRLKKIEEDLNPKPTLLQLKEMSSLNRLPAIASSLLL
jgi:hypothetical protein